MSSCIHLFACLSIHLCINVMFLSCSVAPFSPPFFLGGGGCPTKMVFPKKGAFLPGSLNNCFFLLFRFLVVLCSQAKASGLTQATGEAFLVFGSLSFASQVP